MYESAESCISPLMMIPSNAQEIEEEIWQEEAAAEYQGTRTQLGPLHIKNQIQGTPQETCMS